MKDLSNFIFKEKLVCPFCNKPIIIDIKTECCGHGDYDTLYTVSCDCTRGESSHLTLGILYDIKHPIYSNDDLNILLAYIDYKKNINVLKERFSK